MNELRVRVRPGRIDDIADEAAINRAEGWCYDDQAVLAEYHDDAYEPSAVLIAEIDARVVGKLELFIGWKSAHGRFGLIRRLAIVEGWRGQGVGKTLLDAAIDRAGQDGCTFVELCVDVTNPEAHSFYRREGFVEDRVEVVMRRSLDIAERVSCSQTTTNLTEIDR